MIREDCKYLNTNINDFFNENIDVFDVNIFDKDNLSIKKQYQITIPQDLIKGFYNNYFIIKQYFIKHNKKYYLILVKAIEKWYDENEEIKQNILHDYFKIEEKYYSLYIQIFQFNENLQFESVKDFYLNGFTKFDYGLSYYQKDVINEYLTEFFDSLINIKFENNKLKINLIRNADYSEFYTWHRTKDGKDPNYYLTNDFILYEKNEIDLDTLTLNHIKTYKIPNEYIRNKKNEILELIKESDGYIKIFTFPILINEDELSVVYYLYYEKVTEDDALHYSYVNFQYLILENGSFKKYEKTYELTPESENYDYEFIPIQPIIKKIDNNLLFFDFFKKQHKKIIFSNKQQYIIDNIDFQKKLGDILIYSNVDLEFIPIAYIFERRFYINNTILKYYWKRTDEFSTQAIDLLNYPIKDIGRKIIDLTESDLFSDDNKIYIYKINVSDYLERINQPSYIYHHNYRYIHISLKVNPRIFKNGTENILFYVANSKCLKSYENYQCYVEYSYFKNNIEEYFGYSEDVNPNLLNDFNLKTNLKNYLIFNPFKDNYANYNISDGDSLIIDFYMYNLSYLIENELYFVFSKIPVNDETIITIHKTQARLFKYENDIKLRFIDYVDQIPFYKQEYLGNNIFLDKFKIIEKTTHHGSPYS